MGRMIDIDDIVDAHEVASLLGLNRSTSVAVYRRRYDDFPAPLITKGRSFLWSRSEVATWAKRRRPAAASKSKG